MACSLRDGENLIMIFVRPFREPEVLTGAEKGSGFEGVIVAPPHFFGKRRSTALS